ncbi:MAG TPA: BCAM0308 family protein [Usitatibacter sp.]|nr:BCAM0308 family protein [Usitatibacter sp.]
MKTGRSVFRAGRHEQLMTPPRDDSYRNEAKLHDPTTCPDCGATYLMGRWTWNAGPVDADVAPCPACQRIRDDFPGGYVTLKGAFAREHRDEVLATVRGLEAREKAEHPMQRIMAIHDVAAGIQVTTTDAHLARNIATALKDAFKGHSQVRYAREENLVRAVWERGA